MQTSGPAPDATKAVFRVLLAVSVCHLINDMVQSLLPSIYPILKNSFRLDFGQIGLLSLTYQVVASLLQPLIGLYTDRRPMPYALAIGMCFTLLGIAILATAPTFGLLLVAAAVVGTGSAIFHPESSRIARIASGGQHGFAQSVFQVGGNTGSAIGPLLAAFIVLPQGQLGVAWFSVAASIGIFILYRVGRWRSHHLSRATASHVHRDIRHCCDCGSGSAHILKVLLSGQPLKLLHLLPDQQVSRLGAEFAATLVHLSGCGRGRDILWRAHWRPHRSQICDLGFHPWRAALHAVAP
jgi:MFS family permease